MYDPKKVPVWVQLLPITAALLAAFLVCRFVDPREPAPRTDPHPHQRLGHNWSPMELLMWLQGQGQVWRPHTAGRDPKQTPAIYLFADLPAALSEAEADALADRVARLEQCEPGEPPELWRGAVLVECHRSREEAEARSGYRDNWHRLTFAGDGQQLHRILAVLP